MPCSGSEVLGFAMQEFPKGFLQGVISCLLSVLFILIYIVIAIQMTKRPVILCKFIAKLEKVSYTFLFNFLLIINISLVAQSVSFKINF